MSCKSLNKLGVSYYVKGDNPTLSATAGSFMGPYYFKFNTPDDYDYTNSFVYELTQVDSGSGTWVRHYFVPQSAGVPPHHVSPALACGLGFIECADYNWVNLSGLLNSINGVTTTYYIAYDSSNYAFWIWNDQLSMGNSPAFSASADIWFYLYSMTGQVLGPSGVPGMTPFCSIAVTPPGSGPSPGPNPSSSSSSGSSSSSSSLPPVPAPTILPPSGSYATAVTVYMAPGAGSPGGTTIYYTTDGSIPTEFSSAYSVPFVVPTPGGTVRAMASAAGYSDSAAVTATYSIPMIAALDLIQTADGRLFSAINAAGGVQIEQSAQTQQSVIGYQVLFVPSPTTAGDLKGRV